MSAGHGSRGIGAVVIVVSAACVAFFTLRPGGAGPQAAVPGGYLSSDVVLNILLFVPLGVGFALAGANPLRAAVIGALASGAIELAQLSWIPGRYASVHDLLTNATGTAVGALLVTHWAGRERWWRSLSPWIAGAIVSAWAGGAFLLRASLPGTRWYGQLAHDFAGTEQFDGRVLSLSLQGTPLDDHAIAQTQALRDRARHADTLRLETTVETGSPSSGRAQIVAIVAGQPGEIASIWQEGHSIVARQRLALSDAGLRTPWIRLDSALPARTGEAVTITLEVTRRAFRLSARGPASARESSLALTPDLFWSAFLPGEYHGGDGGRWQPLLPALLTYITLGLALGGRPFRLAAATVVTLLAGPLLAGAAFPDAALLGAAVTGTLAGAWLSSLLKFRKREGPLPTEAALAVVPPAD